MSNKRSSDLWILIKSLSKSEKRYFKISVSGKQDCKYLRLFECIDAQKVHDDKQIMEYEPSFKHSQFSNLKAHLYIKILKSLRNFYLPSIPGFQIRELIDEVYILFNKGLYKQCSQRLKKAHHLASDTDSLELLLEIIKWKKKVLVNTVGWENKTYVNKIIQEGQQINEQINHINHFSNLQSKLQSLYHKTGYIRNEEEFKAIQKIFLTNLPTVIEEKMTITEKIYYYQLHISYYFFIQQFDKGYQYAKKWVELFQQQKVLQIEKLESYISGLNYLLIAQYKMLRYDDFQQVKKILRSLNKLPKLYYNDNIRLKLIKYTFVHEFNALFLLGNFDKGVKLMERISFKLNWFIDQLDAHSSIILFYKAACLYFGYGDFRKSIFWLNCIINSSDTSLREDIHSFAHIMMLINHYELRDTEWIQYYIRSTYRFLIKKQDFHQFQKLILRFLKNLKQTTNHSMMIHQFEILKEKMIQLQSNSFESRAFVYFDIISWLESQIHKKPIKEIIQEKATARNNNPLQTNKILPRIGIAN